MTYEKNIENYIFLKKNKIKINSNDIIKGDIFLALQGSKCHGNKFINSSIRNGAKYCLTDKKDFKLKNNKVIYIKNLLTYLEELAKTKRSLYKGNVIGITGSAGKTTLKETLAFFLKKNNKISYSKKSYNNKLGVIISILNLDLNTKFSIFELGTNNFGEIKYLTNLVLPIEIFITNIQSTHLENFKNKKNIAIEKSDIFLSKYNKFRKNIYLNVNNPYEKKIYKFAKKENKLKVILIGNNKKYFIKKISKINHKYIISFSINKRIFKYETKTLINTQLINILFCFAFFSKHKLNLNTIVKNIYYLKPVDGRGLTHKILIHQKKFKLIDESYNANPDTMLQSIQYFDNINISSNKKILILGDMNELGKDSHTIHQKLIKIIENFHFKKIILCGEMFISAISKISKCKNEYVLVKNRIQIMNYIKNNIHNNDIILAKCSNLTEVNKFTNEILRKKDGKH